MFDGPNVKFIIVKIKWRASLVKVQINIFHVDCDNADNMRYIQPHFSAKYIRNNRNGGRITYQHGRFALRNVRVRGRFIFL